MLERGLQHDAATRITVERKKPWRNAAATFNHGGQAVYRLVDETYSWRETVAAVMEAMLFAPARTDLAFLRFASNLANSWTDLDPVNRMPGLKEAAMRYNRHLWSGYTADANTSHHGRSARGDWASRSRRHGRCFGYPVISSGRWSLWRTC